MKRWKCSVCGYIHEGEEPPEKCPLCGVPAEKFVEVKSIKEDQQEGAKGREKDTGSWKCSVCGHVHDGEGLPEKCPLCGVSSDKFTRLNDTDKKVESKSEGTRGESVTCKCSVCGYVHKGSEPPEKCPLCGVPAEKFVKEENIEKPLEQQKEPEVEKKIVQPQPKKKNFLDFIRGQLLKHHIHPISVHFPNGILPAALVFLIISAFLSVAGLELAAFFNLVFVLINMPLVMLSGYLEWQSRYNAATTLLFKTKIASSLVVIVCLTWLVAWRIINPEIIVQDTPQRWIYLAIAAVMMGAVGLAGHLGGKLVFGGRD